MIKEKKIELIHTPAWLTRADIFAKDLSLPVHYNITGSEEVIIVIHNLGRVCWGQSNRCPTKTNSEFFISKRSEKSECFERLQLRLLSVSKKRSTSEAGGLSPIWSMGICEYPFICLLCNLSMKNDNKYWVR